MRFALVSLFALWVGLGCSGRSSDQDQAALRIYSVARIKGLDPAFTSDYYSGVMSGMVYEQLFEYHYLKRPYQLIPSLAEKMPEWSADKKTLKVKIRSGVLFQDDPCFKSTKGKGREVTAEDFIYSWKRIADPRLRSTGWWIFNNRVVGLDEWRAAQGKVEKTDYDAPVEGIKAIDRYTIEIKLKKPSSFFLYFLAMPYSSVVPKEAVEMYGERFIRSPVGTGPFVLVRRKSNLSSKLVFKKNPTYREAFYPSDGSDGDKERGRLIDAGKRLPLSDKVVVTVFEQSQPQWLSFRKGKIDFSGIPKDNYAEAVTPAKGLSKDLEKRGVKLHTSSLLDVTHVTFNMIDPVVGGTSKQARYLRQAMSLAVNGDKLIELFYNGRAIRAQTAIPPGLEGYQSGFENPYNKFDLAKAKELMKKAGYEDGKSLAPLDYITYNSTASRQMGEFLSESFKQLGIQMKVSSHTWPEFQKKIKNAKGQLWGYAWSADYPDAENFLQMFYSQNKSPGPNDANYSNPEFDKLYEQALRATDLNTRRSLYSKMATMVVEDAPWIFGVHRIGYYLIHPWLRNYKITEFDWTRAKYLRVDPALKKKYKNK